MERCWNCGVPTERPSLPEGCVCWQSPEWSVPVSDIGAVCGKYIDSYGVCAACEHNKECHQEAK